MMTLCQSMVVMAAIGFQFVSLVNIWDDGYFLIGFWFGAVWSCSGHLLYLSPGYCSEDGKIYTSLRNFISIFLTFLLVYSGSRSVIFRYLVRCRRYAQSKKWLSDSDSFGLGFYRTRSCRPGPLSELGSFLDSSDSTHALFPFPLHGVTLKCS